MKIISKGTTALILCAASAFCGISAPAQDLAGPVINTEEAECSLPQETPSRAVTLKKNQSLDIVYPGNGWIYLGETNGTLLFRYTGRKLAADSTSFTLHAQNEGTSMLHFYKNDALTGKYIEDYLSVTVTGISTGAEHVEAPSYADIVPPHPVFGTAAAETGETQPLESTGSSVPEVSQTASASQMASASQTASALQTAEQTVQKKNEPVSSASVHNSGATVIQNTQGSQEIATDESSKRPAKTQQAPEVKKEDTGNLSADEILALAQKAYDAKEYRQSLAYLTDFFDKTVSRVDEGLYLQGLTLEAPSEERNIKQSLDVYRRLVEQFPQSVDWEKAHERIIYLERFYFDIR